MSLHGIHILSARQFEQSSLMHLFRDADYAERVARRGGWPALKGACMIGLFYEPSTRTKISFYRAMQLWGGDVVWTDHASKFSSAIKGETLEDTIRTVQEYNAHVIVLRHPLAGAAERASLVSRIPIINAGDGNNEHPTQALLDIYTIYRAFNGRMRGLKIAVMGDLLNGRTVHSLVQMLANFDIDTIYFLAPDPLQMPQDRLIPVAEKGIRVVFEKELGRIVSDIDVLYDTRIQKERFSSESVADSFRGQFVVTPDLVDRMKQDAIVMHPLPRNEEIPVEVDVYKQAYYFKQVHYGMILRMALIRAVVAGGHRGVYEQFRSLFFPRR